MNDIERTCLLEQLTDEQWRGLLELLDQLEGETAQVAINDLALVSGQAGDTLGD